MEFRIVDSQLQVNVDASIYDIDVLHKCFYWYGGNFSVDISSTTDGYLVRLAPTGKQSIEESFDDLCEKIKLDLIDFKLRDIVTKETQTVRELITAKAFAYYDTDANPTSVISDPVGFTPESIQS